VSETGLGTIAGRYKRSEGPIQSKRVFKPVYEKHGGGGEFGQWKKCATREPEAAQKSSSIIKKGQGVEKTWGAAGYVDVRFKKESQVGETP